MQVNLSRPDVLMAEQVLNSSDVVAAFDQVCGEAMAQGVTASVFVDEGSLFGDLEGALDTGFTEMMAMLAA